jgi:hypothetical protein
MRGTTRTGVNGVRLKMQPPSVSPFVLFLELHDTRANQRRSCQSGSRLYQLLIPHSQVAIHHSAIWLLEAIFDSLFSI